MSTAKAMLRTMGTRVAAADFRRVRPAPKTADSFYLSPEWRAFVEALIVERFGSKANARCEDKQCRHPHRLGIRVFGDHIVELKDDGPALSKANILFRCGACHTRKTAEQRARRLAQPPAGLE